jgi:hypothetical protein
MNNSQSFITTIRGEHYYYYGRNRVLSSLKHADSNIDMSQSKQGLPASCLLGRFSGNFSVSFIVFLEKEFNVNEQLQASITSVK